MSPEGSQKIKSFGKQIVGGAVSAAIFIGGFLYAKGQESGVAAEQLKTTIQKVDSHLEKYEPLQEAKITADHDKLIALGERVDALTKALEQSNKINLELLTYLRRTK